MDDDAAWDALIGDIYLSATDAEARRRLPDAFAREVGGVTGVLWTVDPATGRPASAIMANMPPEAEQPYLEHYYRLDPWMTHFHRMPWNEPVHGATLVGNEALLRSEYYNDFARRLGTFHVVGSRVSLSDDPAAPFGALAVFRPKEREPFTGSEAARLRRLMPHLRRAWQIGEQLGPRDLVAKGWEAGVAAVLRGLRAAAIVTDGHARVHLANAAAERVDAAGGLRLRGAPPDRALCLAAQGDTRRLHAAIADAARGGPGGELVLPGPAGPLRLTVSPLPRHLMGDGGWAMLLVTSEAPTADEITRRRAERLFGLTRSEAEVAILLASGLAPAEIAEARGVRLSTIRAQLLHALDKTETGDLRRLAVRMTLLRD